MKRYRSSETVSGGYQALVYDVDLPETINWDKIYSTKTNTSVVRRYQTPITQTPVNLIIHPSKKKKSVEPALQTHQAQKREKIKLYWLFSVGVGMIVMLALWVAIGVIGNWWHGFQDDQQYGRPRTYQCDANIGHNDAQTPSHFIAENLNRHILILEFPGGDLSKALVYAGPTLFGPDQELTPVTLSFKDVNADGKPDMIITIQGSQTVFLNDGAKFRPATPQDHINVEGQGS